jgi:hypothetical protein
MLHVAPVCSDVLLKARSVSISIVVFNSAEWDFQIIGILNVKGSVCVNK